MSSKDKILAYIYKFATEENLDDLSDFLVEHYPSVSECSNLHIPHRGLYSAVEAIETAREQDETKEVRALFNYYDQILDIPQTENGIPLCALPEPRAQHNSTNVENFSFNTNILSCSHHTRLPNIIVTTSSSRDLTITYMPTANILSTDDKPIQPLILARLTNLTSVLLTTQLILLHNPITHEFTALILAGGIDGTFHVFNLAGLSHELFPQLEKGVHVDQIDIIEPGTPNYCNQSSFIDQLKAHTFRLTSITSCKPHQRYLTRIISQQDIYSPLPSPSIFRIATGSQDQTITFIDLVYNGPEQIECVILKHIEFKGKVEAMCLLPTPTSFQDRFHPVLLYPSLVPTTVQSRFHHAAVRKLFKGNYLDNVEFIAPHLPYTRHDTSSSPPSSSPQTHLFAASIRNDANLQIIDIIKMEVVDKMNVNINGDDHVSFTVLDMVYDSYYGLLYLATDAQTIVIMDTMTRQHIRRLYCTDNNDLSTPIMRLIPIPSFSVGNIVDENDATSITALIKFAPYRNLVAISTANNSVKIYNQHNQTQIVEFPAHSKNIKGFVVIPTAHPTEPFSFITTGFDKTFTVHF